MISQIVIPLSILVILPSIVIFSEIYYLEVSASYPSYLKYFELLTVIIVLMYGLLSYSLTTKKYFNNGWIENLLAEYEFLKKLLYVGLPVLIMVMLLFLSTYQPENPNFIFALFPGLILIVGGALLRFTFNVTKKDFRFYYAKACFQLLSEETDEAERMNLLIRALKSYNKYLKRILKLQVSNIDNIYSKIISDNLLNKQEFTKSISSSFHSDDKLEPTKQLLNLLDIQNTEQFLVREPLWERIKEWGAFLAAIIPVLISVIQFLYRPT